MVIIALFFIFIQISLLVPGYSLVKKLDWFKDNAGIQLSVAYAITIFFYALLASLNYGFNIPGFFARALTWLVVIISLYLVARNGHWKELLKMRLLLIGVFLMPLLSLAFISLPFNAPRNLIPDPQPLPNRNYTTLNVKVLNVAHTRANDNYIPYRQAQFFANRSDPAKDSFINEWGVNFFERTPLMGAVAANYFNAFHEKLPLDYSWSATTSDVNHTYLQFQLLAMVLNSLLIVPGFFLIQQLFNKRTAQLALYFLIPSTYFAYNSFFTWPKSLVGFFILTSWLLLLDKKRTSTFAAGLVSGTAYLTHDLAFLYIGTSVVLLLVYKRFVEILIFLAPVIALAFPWLFLSNIKYHTPTTFTEYPFSTTGIPASGKSSQLIHRFLHTSPWHLLRIRIDNLFYLLSPYQILTSEGGHSIPRRFFGLSLYSITGSVGLGLLVPFFISACRNLKDRIFWILTIMPVVFCALFIGWPEGLGSLHFAEAIVLLFTGLSVFYLTQLQSRFWLLAAFALNIVQLLYFIYFSYDYAIGRWFSSTRPLACLSVLFGIIAICAFQIIKLSGAKTQSPKATSTSRV